MSESRMPPEAALSQAQAVGRRCVAMHVVLTEAVKVDIEMAKAGAGSLHSAIVD